MNGGNFAARSLGKVEIPPWKCSRRQLTGGRLTSQLQTASITGASFSPSFPWSRCPKQLGPPYEALYRLGRLNAFCDFGASRLFRCPLFSHNIRAGKPQLYTCVSMNHIVQCSCGIEKTSTAGCWPRLRLRPLSGVVISPAKDRGSPIGLSVSTSVMLLFSSIPSRRKSSCTLKTHPEYGAGGMPVY